MLLVALLHNLPDCFVCCLVPCFFFLFVVVCLLLFVSVFVICFSSRPSGMRVVQSVLTSSLSKLSNDKNTLALTPSGSQ